MIEASYPLSPSQKGMLFETLASGRAGLHVEQAVITLRGEVDPLTFAAAWQYVAARHPILRTRFRWDGLDEPIQDVLDTVDIEIDCRERSAVGLKNYIEEDRAKAFDLAAGPLLRVALFRGPEQIHQSVWTTHHILLDGWSVALVVRDLVAAYDALHAGIDPHSTAPRPYADFVSWLRGQDSSDVEAFWRRNLAGVDKPTTLGRVSEEPTPCGYGAAEKRILFSRTLSEELRRLTRRSRVPLNILFQALWGLLLSRYSGEEKVVFGATVSGRPPELAGSESMVGLFINTVPIAMHVPRAMPFPSWLGALHDAQVDREPFDYCSTAEIHAWSSVPAALPLFESLIVFENYPHDDASFTSKSFAVDLSTSRSIGARTRYPLILIVEPGNEIALTAVYDEARLDVAAAGCIVQDFLVLAETVAAAPHAAIGALLDGMRSRAIPRVRPLSRVSRADAPPRTATEAKVAAICADVLGVDRVGLHESFFDLGGHSLLAARVLSRLRDAFSIDLPLRVLFDRPTVEELSRAIDDEAPAKVTGIVRQERRDRFPPSFQQERLWFVDQLQERSSAYNAQAALHIDGDLDVRVLRGSLDELVRRHEILRTAFRATDGRVCQEVVAPVPLPLTEVDGDDVHALAAEEMLRPFDLASPPLLRVLLQRRSASEHVLVLTIHHIVTDGWSNSIFFRELAKSYEAFAAGKPSPLPELTIQYGDYAAWQRESIDGSRLEELSAFWKTALADAPRRLDLPTDFPRPAMQQGRGELRTIDLSTELSAALRRTCSAEGTTLFMTLLAALNVLLSRLSGQDDVVVGTPIANRGRSETEGLIGFFVNTLALRTSLAGHPSLRALLRRVRAVALDAFAHAEMPFERLVEELKPERDLSRNPLFQLFLNVLNVPPAAMALGNLDVRPFPLPELVTRFDITLYAIDDGAAIRLDLLYDKALFRPETIERMLEQLRLILEQIGTAPDLTIDECSLVLDADRRLLPDLTRQIAAGEWGAIHDAFSANAARAPERMAVVDDDGAWSYGQLDAISNRVANTLEQRGVGPGSVVAIYAIPAASLVWSLLGVLKSGAAFVILDAAHPAPRLRRIVDTVAPATLLALEPLPPLLAETLGQLCFPIDVPSGSPEALAGLFANVANDDRAASAVSGDAVAYIAFTSGSTGEPLGIVGTHNPVTHFLDWHARTFALGDGDRFSLLSGLSHDPLLRDVFTPLSLGASLHIPPRDARQSVEQLASWVRDHDITVAHLTPALGEWLSGAGQTLPALRWAFFGGDVLRGDLVRRMRLCAPACRVVNFYGATETPQAMAFHTSNDDERAAAVPIGRGIDDVQLLLLNDAGTLAGIGEQAEICIHTPYLSRGYLNDASSDRFVSETLYRTGDLGRYRPDGSVEIAGRKGRQLTMRGFRIEPREVEAVLEEHPAIKEAVVVATNDGEALVACVVPRPGEIVSVDDCRRFVAERLPDFLRPSRIVTAAALPLTPNGKIDRAAVIEILCEENGEHFAPVDDAERALAAIWEEVLGIANVSATANFFALGGHSLKATRVVSRIHRDLGVILPLRDFMRTPVLRDLAGRIRALKPAVRHRIAPIPSAGSYAVSHAQRRLWTLAQLGETGVAYNMPRALLLNGELDTGAFACALRDVVARHESLRTTFVTIGDELRQRVDDAATIDIPLIDLSAEANPHRRAAELADEDEARPFDLERGPLLRASLLRLTAGEHVLLFNAHHIVVDAWSLDVLVRDLVAAYEARSRDESPSWPPLRIQYRDYAASQSAMVESDEAKEHLRHWRETLAAPLPVLDLPLDFARPPVKTWNGRRTLFALTAEESEALAALARAHDVSLYILLVAIVKVLLHRYTGADDIIVGAPTAGRNDADLETQVGFYVNVLPLRDRLDGEDPFTELLGDVARTATDAYEHQDVPFDRLVAELNVPRETSRSPIFDIVVVLQNAERSELRLGDVRIEPFPRQHRGCKFDLNFTFQEEEGHLAGYVEYNTDLWRDDRAARAVSHFRELVRSVVADPHERVARLNLLPEWERRLVVEELNATDASYPSMPIHELFDDRALAQPDDVAVIFGERSLTYGVLLRRTNALARTLTKRHGVVRGDRVGVVMERSENVIVALLAVLKAGAAYVPVDPSLPAERIRFILDDAGCRFVIDDDFVDGAEDDAAPNVEVGLDDPAYVIYTSGSTGQPKGCVVTHRNVVRLMVNDRFRFDFSRRDTWVVAHSFAFDFSVWEMYGALLYGGRLVVAPRDDVRNPAALRALLRRHRVTVLNQTPGSFYALIDVERSEEHHDLDDHLRLVIFGGDRLDPVQLRPWVEIYPLERVQLVNMYGITETTVHVSYGPLSRDDIFGEMRRSLVGVPLPETRVYVCGSGLTLQPLGVAGELYIGGSGVCRGYLNRPELTAQRFVPSPFRQGETLYRSGDVGRWLPGGTLEYFGRNDNQVQIRGFRVELGEIERVLASHDAVRAAVVRVWQPPGDERDVDKRLVAYVVADGDVTDLRAFARQKLPDYMVPSDLVTLDAIPLTSNGKIDSRALPSPVYASTTAGPSSDVEKAIAAIWCDLLHRDAVAVDENFFDLGGHSLLLVHVHRALRERLGSDLPLVELFRFPTVRALAQRLRGESEKASPAPAAVPPAASHDIAIIGMAGRFPGAPDVETFWRRLCDGVESSTTISDDELRAAGVAEHLIADPAYVRRKPLLDGIEDFDPAFFGMSAREAEVMDPQHRLFLECAWEALENAGYDSERCAARIGVFGGVSFNSYLLGNLLPNRESLESLGAYPLLIGNDRDFVTTRVSYKLNLRGPSINVSTACSTSLVAVHLACRGLIEQQCDMALAGAASVKVPQHEGYIYDDGGILSPDGRCRAFDAGANGTVGGSGAGIVVLKRLEDALRDGDRVVAVIKGSAIGNDGSEKIGYTAPSLTGQAGVIAEAHRAAGIDPESIGYVEAHGTGTSLGDPIEIAALTQAFRERTQRSGFCAIGSVKTNIGHLDAAAGVAGLIKTVLALQRKLIPPSLNYRAPNPNIDFPASPFYVNTTLAPWPERVGPRRSGVSSFGLGGTNVHLVLEEAPPVESASSPRPLQLLPIAARTPAALSASVARLSAHFAERPEDDLADAAWTLAAGRRAFAYRAVAVCGDTAEAADLLLESDPRRVVRGHCDGKRNVVFLFPGGGAQHARMGEGLYAAEPFFREELDRCAELLRPHIRTDIRLHLADADAMVTTSLGLPALFAIEYALARQWMAWGVRPSAMIGHSLGEYVAACLAGVFTLDDALALVAWRGRLFETIERGEMLSVPMSENELIPLLGSTLSIAAINHPSSCVISGPLASIDALAALLAMRGVEAKRLHIAVAAHSALVDPIVDDFRDFVAGLHLRAPEIAFISNITGKPITAGQACDPSYWSSHLRQAVRFAGGLATLLRDPEAALLEVGPGNALTSLALRHPSRLERHAVVASMRHPNDTAQSDLAVLLGAAGRLWIEGAPIDWAAFHGTARRRRIVLPGAVFERRRCWIDAKPQPFASLERRPNVADWFYAPSWKRALSLPPSPRHPIRWLLISSHALDLSDQLAAFLRDRGDNVAVADEPVLDNAALPDRIVDLSAVTFNDDPGSDSRRGFYPLLRLTREWRRVAPERDVRITIVTTHAHDVTGDEPLEPEKAAVFGLVKVLGQESPHFRCDAIDLVLRDGADCVRAVDALQRELVAEPSAMFAAWRGGYRWTLCYEPLCFDDRVSRLRECAVILITGGTGGVGLFLARQLATTGARLVLVSRHARAVDPARIREIESLGGEVLLVDADVAEAEEIRGVIAQSVVRFGALHGVIHAAGITSGSSIFRGADELSDDDCETQFRPKIDGVRALAAALTGRELDFVLLMSSNASVLGGLGLAAYAAANQFLDLFVAQQNRISPVPWISASWDGWPTHAGGRGRALSTSIERFAMDEREAWDAFRRVVGSGRGHVVVSAGDLLARLDRWTKLDAAEESVGERMAMDDDRVDGPRNAVEQGVAAVWLDMLGAPRVGIFDNFFELRGDSLLGTRMITRLNRHFGVRVPLRALFEDPTIAGLAERVGVLLGHETAVAGDQAEAVV